jgi:hypothetical protein
VLGAGYIAVEMAGIFHGLGSETLTPSLSLSLTLTLNPNPNP